MATAPSTLYCQASCTTLFTSAPRITKSPVIAALPPPVGWKLMAVATPIDGGITWPLSRTAERRGTLTWYTPPFTLPVLRRAFAIAAVSRSIGALAAGADLG